MESKLKSSQTYWDFFLCACNEKVLLIYSEKNFLAWKQIFYCENSKLNLPSEYPSAAVKNGKY